MATDLANLSVPLIAVILLIRELASALGRRRNGNGVAPSTPNGDKAVAEARIEAIDRRTEEMVAALRTLPVAIEELTHAFRETTRAVGRLVERGERVTRDE